MKRTHIDPVGNSSLCTMLKRQRVLEPRQTKVQFGEVTVIIIPMVEEDTSSTLWWSATDIQYFRMRKRQERMLKQRVSAMTLVVTNHTERRAALASALFQSSGYPHGKYIACEHPKLENKLEILNIDFQRVVIDGDNETECAMTVQLIQKFCPFAYVLIVSSSQENRFLNN